MGLYLGGLIITILHYLLQIHTDLTVLCFTEESILHWRRDAKKSVWMKVPIAQSYLIPVAFDHGFRYHHAVGEYAMLLKWLPQRVSCNVPPYATHQVGVAGIGTNL